MRLALPRSKSGRRVDVVFTGDRHIAELAGRYRHSPYATDVLSFSYIPGFLGPGAPGKKTSGRHRGVALEDELLGEVVISLDTARRQARERRVPFEHELILLCIHGLLHLAGIDDENYKGWCEMRRAEFETLMRIL